MKEENELYSSVKTLMDLNAGGINHVLDYIHDPEKVNNIKSL